MSTWEQIRIEAQVNIQYL